MAAENTFTMMLRIALDASGVKIGAEDAKKTLAEIQKALGKASDTVSKGVKKASEETEKAVEGTTKAVKKQKQALTDAQKHADKIHRAYAKNIIRLQKQRRKAMTESVDAERKRQAAAAKAEQKALRERQRAQERHTREVKRQEKARLKAAKDAARAAERAEKEALREAKKAEAEKERARKARFRLFSAMARRSAALAKKLEREKERAVKSAEREKVRVTKKAEREREQAARKAAAQRERAERNAAAEHRRLAAAATRNWKAAGFMVADYARRVGGALVRAARNATIAMTALGAAVVYVGSRFEQQIAVIASIKSGTDDAGNSVDLFARKARELGESTAFTATQAAEAMEILARAGLSVGDTLSSAEAALKLAGAEGVSMERTAQLLTSVLSIFEDEALSASEAADILGFASSNSKFNIESLTEAMKFGGIAGAAFGADLATTTALMSKFVDRGFEGSMAGTQLRTAMAQLADPTTKAVKILEKYGLTVDDVNPATNDLVDVLDRLGQAGISAEDSFALFTKRAGAGVLQLTRIVSEDRAEIEGYISDMRNSAGLTAKRYAITMDTVRGRTAEFVSKIQELMLQVFDTFRGPLKGVITELRDLMTEVLLVMEERAMVLSASMEGAFGRIAESIRENKESFAEGIVFAIEATGRLISLLGRLVELGAEIGNRFGLQDKISGIRIIIDLVSSLISKVNALGVTIEGVSHALTTIPGANIVAMMATALGLLGEFEDSTERIQRIVADHYQQIDRRGSFAGDPEAIRAYTIEQLEAAKAAEALTRAQGQTLTAMYSLTGGADDLKRALREGTIFFDESSGEFVSLGADIAEGAERAQAKIASLGSELARVKSRVAEFKAAAEAPFTSPSGEEMGIVDGAAAPIEAIRRMLQLAEADAASLDAMISSLRAHTDRTTSGVRGAMDDLLDGIDAGAADDIVDPFIDAIDRLREFRSELTEESSEFNDSAIKQEEKKHREMARSLSQAYEDVIAITEEGSDRRLLAEQHYIAASQLEAMRHTAAMKKIAAEAAEAALKESRRIDAEKRKISDKENRRALRAQAWFEQKTQEFLGERISMRRRHEQELEALSAEAKSRFLSEAQTEALLEDLRQQHMRERVAAVVAGTKTAFEAVASFGQRLISLFQRVQGMIEGLAQKFEQFTKFSLNLAAGIEAIFSRVKSVREEMGEIIAAIERGDMLTDDQKRQVAAAGGVSGDPKGAAREYVQAMADDAMLFIEAMARGLPTLINSLLAQFPRIVDALVAAVPQVVDALVSGLPRIVSALADGMIEVVDSLLAQKDKILDGLRDIIDSLVDHFIQHLAQQDEIIRDFIAPLVTALIEGGVKGVIALAQEIPTIVRAILESLPVIIEALLVGVGDIVAAVVLMIPDLIRAILDAIPEIIVALIRGVIEAIPVIIDALVAAIPEIIQAIFEAIPEMVDEIVVLLADPAIINAIINLAIKLVETVVMMIPRIYTALVKGFVGFLAHIVQNIPKIARAFVDWIAKAVTESIPKFAKSIGQAIVQGFENAWASIAEFFEKIFLRVFKPKEFEKRYGSEAGAAAETMSSRQSRNFAEDMGIALDSVKASAYTGMRYVPTTMRVTVHPGEKIVPRNANADAPGGNPAQTGPPGGSGSSSSGDVTTNVFIDGELIDRAVVNAARRGKGSGVKRMARRGTKVRTGVDSGRYNRYSG